MRKDRLDFLYIKIYCKLIEIKKHNMVKKGITRMIV